MSDEPVTFVDLEDGWKSVRIGGREALQLQLPPGPISVVDMMTLTEHLMKLARDGKHGAS